MKRILLPAVIAGVLALLVGVARGAGALMLLSEPGSSGELTVGILLAVVAVWLMAGGIVFLAKRTPATRNFLAVGVVAFWLGGIINGFLLYGAPQISGQIVNIVVAAVILLCPYRWSVCRGKK